MGYGVDCIPDREFCDIKSRRSATSLQKGKTFLIKSKVTTFFSLPLRSIITMRKYVVFIGLLIWNTIGFAQVPGTWNEYFSFRNIQQLEAVDDNVFALSENGIFIYNTSTQEIQKVTKLNGLSTVGLSCMAFCDSTSSFLIGYGDGTLDILEYPSLRVHAIPTIANKSIYGSKKINSVVMHNDTAIIATGFGVLTFSMTTKNFISTTVLSNDGSYVAAKSVANDKQTIYAATTKGIFTALLSNPNLSDFSIWKKLSGIPFENDTISHIAVLDGTIYYVHKNTLDASKDSIFRIKDGTADAFKTQSPNVTNVTSKNHQLFVSSYLSAAIYDSEEKLTHHYDKTRITSKYCDIIKLNNGEVFIGDEYHGLYEYFSMTNIIPNCPLSNHIRDMFFQDNSLHIVCGNFTLWEQLYYSVKDPNGIWYGHNDWRYNNSFCVFPIQNTSTYYIGTHGNGLLENSVAWESGNQYDATNSILQTYYLYKLTVIDDITADSKGILWMLNSGTRFPIVAKDLDNNWYSYYVAKTTGNVVNQQNLFNQIIVDSRGYKWLSGTGQLTVFYENKTLDNTDDDLLVRIPLNDNEGSIAEKTTCLAEDLDGEIWIGTTEGIAVHSAPSRVFKDRQIISRIKIEVDGEVGYLLSSESISCIAVDGANRKWIGTEKSGVFLISENGTEQILNFTKNNSPLPSNAVRSIVIDHATGEVYIGTEEGLVSYICDATVGDAEMSDVYVFPNPVRETYEGDIYIKGVVADAVIKITDVSGNLVRTVTAHGGTAVWDGRNVYGDRVKTGVYLLYISDETGKTTKVAKLVFVN